MGLTHIEPIIVRGVMCNVRSAKLLLDDDTASIQQFAVDKSSMRVDDPVNHPSHYETGKF